MSEIDKLINQAFPDELRDIEPIDVDEDAILAMTLESLGLEQPVLPELPAIPAKPLRRLTGRRAKGKKEEPGTETQPGLIEVPVVVRHRWVDLAGWAIAACLVLVCAVNWGPWLINNLDFGIGPRSSGDISVPESSGDVSSAHSGYMTAESSNNARVSLVKVSYGEGDTVIITLYFSPLDDGESLDQFDIKVDDEFGSNDVTRIRRSNSDQKVVLTYKLDLVRYLILTVRQLVPLLDDNGEEVGLAYQDIEKLEMDLNTGTATSQISNNRFDFAPYGTLVEPAAND